MPEYFTLPELRGLPDMGAVNTYTDAAVELAAAYIVGVIERVVGTSFIGRTLTETYDGGDGWRYGLPLRSPFVVSVTSVTENGVAVSPVPVDPDGSGVLYKYPTGATRPSLWSYGRANIVVTYVAGYSTVPPGDVKEAALQGTRYRLLATRSGAGQTGRRKNLVTDAGTFDLSTAGPDAPTGYPEVDAVIIGWRELLGSVGFA